MPVTKRLQNKVVVVTGATAGIGLATSERLLSEGARVVVSSRKAANVERVVAELRGRYGEVSCVGVAGHVAVAEDRTRLVQAALDTYGRIDGLVSNVAVSPGVGSLAEVSEAQFDKVMDVNIKSAFLLAQLVIPHMQAIGGGSIIFVSSISAYVPQSPLGLYGISKTALIGLTKAFAEELGMQGIRVNCVAPGTIRTKFSELLWKGPAAEVLESTTMLKRFGESEEIASVIAFLISDDASYITSESIVAAGGMTSHL